MNTKEAGATAHDFEALTDRLKAMAVVRQMMADEEARILEQVAVIARQPSGIYRLDGTDGRSQAEITKHLNSIVGRGKFVVASWPTKLAPQRRRFVPPGVPVPRKIGPCRVLFPTKEAATMGRMALPEFHAEEISLCMAANYAFAGTFPKAVVWHQHPWDDLHRGFNRDEP